MNVPGLAARAAALALTRAVFEKRRPLEETPALAKLDDRDRAFAHHLALTLCRRVVGLDRLIDAHIGRAPPAAARAVLRLGAAQLRLMRTPAHAVVDTAVELAKKNGAAKQAGMVNAILRKIARDEGPVAAEPPGWIARAVTEAFGAEAAAGLSAALSEDAPPLDLTVFREIDRYETEMRAVAETERFGDQALRLIGAPPPVVLPGYAEGGWQVQDRSASIPARVLLALASGGALIDLCAAPGGKTAQLAAAGASVTAVDRSAPRLERLKENLARLQLGDRVTPIAAEAQSWRPETPADGVLIDAPCTATGTLRRHPDALWTKGKEDVAGFTATQDALLDAAVAMVRPEGALVYATCSLLPQEGEARMAAFLKRQKAVEAVAIDPAAFGLPATASTRNGALRLLPHLTPGGMDGFFIAAFRRQA